MKEQTSENFQSEIHVRDYQKQFEQHKIDANNFMLTDGRQKEFLNGNWHFIADQYACTLRGEWFKEQKFDEHGQNRPYDFDFDYWQETKVPSCWNMQSSELFYYESLLSVINLLTKVNMYIFVLTVCRTAALYF